MKKEFKNIVGIDVSKKTIDAGLLVNEADATILKKKFSNNIKGYKALNSWMKENNAGLKDTLFCLENTGIYHRLLTGWLLQQQAFVWAETPVQIKWSMGIQRGKSDPVDAGRICTYAFRNQDKAVLYSQTNKTVQKIADLLALRKRLLDNIKTLKVPVKELKDTGLKEAAKLVEASCKKSIVTMEKEVQKVEEKIQQLIDADPELAKKYKYASSVRCVGFTAVVTLIVYTNGFQRFDNAKQLASYCGIAPFEYSSGTSIKGKTKVHPMANKTLKTAMHMCSVSAVRHNEEMKTYFIRKVAEGKNKMSVLNAVRNKLIHRVFACIRDEKEYSLKRAA